MQDEIEKAKRLVSPNTIIMGFRGSIAHGMYVPSDDPDSIDDIDFMSICIPPLEHYVGLFEWSSSETREIFDGNVDIVEYGVRKFVKLLLKGNPNVVSMLWLRPENYQILTDKGRELITHREIFLSREQAASFCGYANAQLSKMGKIAGHGFRGEKRKELFDRYGYDTKNAAHCIRLLRMCREFLQTGVMNVDRSGIDGEELIAIKRGAWSFDRTSQEAQALFNDVKQLKDTSPLPAEPDYRAANELLLKMFS